MSVASAPAQASGPLAPRVAVASTLLVYAVVQAVAWIYVGGFEYPIDDVYIHLALAEQIAAGNYGVNPGEIASPASSPLYPLLLVPFAGTEAQRLLPALWNLAGLVAAAALFGRLLVQAGLSAPAAIAAAALAPVAFNLAGIAVLGMEHSLHLAASLAVLSGLATALRQERVPPLLVAGVLLAPAFRPEGLALALAAAGCLLLRGRVAAGVGLGALACLPLALLAAGLLALGLDPLPSSVLTKLDTGGGGPLAGMAQNLSYPAGALLAGLSAVCAVAAALAFAAGRAEAGWIALVAAAAGAAHVVVGRDSLLARYEPYAVAVVLAGLLFALAGAERRARIGIAALALALAAPLSWYYVANSLRTLPPNALAIRLQQVQMARFAQDYAGAPVAVNDLGAVAWTNPHPVLDLWGLASPDARRVRLSDPAPGWAGPLAERHGVDLAMIYDEWLGAAVAADWLLLGHLAFDLADPRIAGALVGVPLTLGGSTVDFYATDPDAAPRLRAALAAWSATLPDGALFVPEGGG